MYANNSVYIVDLAVDPAVSERGIHTLVVKLHSMSLPKEFFTTYNQYLDSKSLV